MRFSLSSALIGALGLVALVAGASTAMIMGGYTPVQADSQPPAIEKRLAMYALHRVVDREATQDDGPLPATDATLTAGAKLYAQNCAVCHGASDGLPTTIAAGLYQKPPQFAKHGVDDDPAGETYWKIVHGIRFTGMPAYAKTLNDQQAWEIALFLKHLPELPPHAQAAWGMIHAPGQLAAPIAEPNS